MAKKKKSTRVQDYRHDEKRKNNPPIGMVSYEPKISEPKIKRYGYDPHLSPQLIWAGKPGLKTIEVEDEQARAKHEAAKRWCDAVSDWGEMGKWKFDVCKDPKKLKNIL